jgi:hypothetical protein
MGIGRKMLARPRKRGVSRGVGQQKFDFVREVAFFGVGSGCGHGDGSATALKNELTGNSCFK